jgi:RNA polymerase sigma factor (sigma-70 family)
LVAGKRLTDVVRQLGRLGDLQGDLALPDAQLLDRFVCAQDETAFTALVARHGPMVLGLCRRLLRDGPDVEDAFQAVFLVLVRKAAAVGRRELLGNWLYGVAFRVASDLRAQAARRARRRSRLDPGELAAPDGPDAPELPALLDAEVARLPDKYRRPVVLCYLQGQTNEEAARQLSWPVGTVKGRLSRARDLLRSRLARRGLALSAAALAEALTATASAAVPSPLLASVLLTAAGASSAAVSARAAALSQGVFRTMLLSRLKIAGLVFVGLLGAGAALLAFRGPTPAPDDPKKQPAPRDKPDRARGDRERLQGVWDATAVEVDGKEPKDPDNPDKKTSWEFQGERVFMTEDQTESKAQFKLDPTKTPRALDVVLPPRAVGDKELTIPCVYQLDGDVLKVCMPRGEGGRPSALASKAGDNNMLMTFKRRADAKGPGDALRRRYGDKTIAILQGATRLEAFRLQPDDYVKPGDKDDGKAKRFGGYAIIGSADEQKEKVAARAAALLLDRDNFALDQAKGCKFQPGVGLRFWKGKEFADVILCYHCNELMISAPDTAAQGVKTPYADFDPGQAALVKLAKELFPKDEVIQDLKESGD